MTQRKPDDFSAKKASCFDLKEAVKEIRISHECEYVHPTDKHYRCPFPQSAEHNGVLLCPFHYAAVTNTPIDLSDDELAVLRNLVTTGKLKSLPEWRLITPKLDNLTLDDFEFYKCSFVGADFSWGVFHNLNLCFSDFSRAEFGFSRSNAGKFYKSVLIAASFKASFFTYANFTDSMLCEAVFRQANLSFSTFKKCNMSGLRAANSDFSSCNIASCDLSGSNFRSARLRYAQLRNVDLSGTDLRGVDFTGASLVDVKFVGANLKDAIGLGEGS